jgi:hypothetical protein
VAAAAAPRLARFAFDGGCDDDDGDKAEEEEEGGAQPAVAAAAARRVLRWLGIFLCGKLSLFALAPRHSPIYHCFARDSTATVATKRVQCSSMACTRAHYTVHPHYML